MYGGIFLSLIFFHLQKKDNLDDIDALLGSASPAKPAPAASKMDDLDALLNDIPRKSTATPKKQSTTDDIDDLLAGLDKPAPRRSAAQSTSSNTAGMDDIDALLAGVSKRPLFIVHALLAPTASPPAFPSDSYAAQRRGDDLDDLLAGIDGGGSKKTGMDAIDDLLNNLNQ